MIVLILSSAFTVDAQTIKVIKVMPDNSGDSLHAIANMFARRVGNALKQSDARVKVWMSLDTVISGGRTMLRLEYSATLVPCDHSRAQKHFDRRGALSARPDAYSSHRDAEHRAKVQAGILEKAFQRQYGSSRIIMLSDQVSYRGLEWAIHERFITDK